MSGFFIRNTRHKSIVTSGICLVFLCLIFSGTQLSGAELSMDVGDEDLKVNIGGGFVMDYFQPLSDTTYKGKPTYNVFKIFEASLKIDVEFGRYRLHMTPLIGDDYSTRPWHLSSTWIKEMYGAAILGPVTIKVGKVFSRLGLFWDNSWWGSAQEYDGLKLDPEMGLSVEGNIENVSEFFGMGEWLDLAFWAQYFVIDATSYALPNRDSHTAGAPRIDQTSGHRRNQFFLRVEPRLKVSEEYNIGITPGLGWNNFEADLPGVKGDLTPSSKRVWRIAGDLTLTAGPCEEAVMRHPAMFAAWAEYTRQWGYHVESHPFVGAPGIDNEYWMFGGELTPMAPFGIDWFTMRLNVNRVNYRNLQDQNYQNDTSNTTFVETRILPGFTIALNKHMAMQFEFGHVEGKTISDNFNTETGIWGKTIVKELWNKDLYLVFHAMF